MTEQVTANDIKPRTTVHLGDLDREIAAAMMNKYGIKLSSVIRMSLRNQGRALGLQIPGLQIDPQQAAPPSAALQ